MINVRCFINPMAHAYWREQWKYLAFQLSTLLLKTSCPLIVNAFVKVTKQRSMGFGKRRKMMASMRKHTIEYFPEDFLLVHDKCINIKS